MSQSLLRVNARVEQSIKTPVLTVSGDVQVEASDIQAASSGGVSGRAQAESEDAAALDMRIGSNAKGNHKQCWECGPGMPHATLIVLYDQLHSFVQN